jgi:hypothetical protein
MRHHIPMRKKRRIVGQDRPGFGRNRPEIVSADSEPRSQDRRADGATHERKDAG